MEWCKLYATFATDPKVADLSDRAFRRYVEGMCYAALHETDGAARFPVDRYTAELEAAGLVELGTIHGWVGRQKSKDEMEAGRQASRRRTALSRDTGLKTLIRERDGDSCRYCGVAVSWTDRRSATGATFDHIEPSGPNTPENLVVACRGCNSAKGSRSPAAAGLELLEPLQERTKNVLIQSREEVEVEVDIETAKQEPAVRVDQNPYQPTDRQMYFGDKLAIGVPAIVKLNKKHGREFVLSAMEQVHGFPPEDDVQSAFAYIDSVAAFKQAGVA